MLLDHIRQVYPRLTRSQKRIADYLSTSYHQAAFMTAAELARRLDLNEATVIRFAQRLGFQGYPGLSTSVQELVKREVSTIPSPDTRRDAILDLLVSQDESLKRAINVFPVEIAKGMVSAIRQAAHIMIIGHGVAAHLAGILEYGLRMQGFHAQLVSGDVPAMSTAMGNLAKGDVVIGLCLENPGDILANALALARESGSPALAFVGSPVSAPAQAADLALVCSANSTSPLPQLTVGVAYIEALLRFLAQSGRDQTGAREESVAKARARISGGDLPAE